MTAEGEIAAVSGARFTPKIRPAGSLGAGFSYFRFLVSSRCKDAKAVFIRAVKADCLRRRA